MHELEIMCPRSVPFICLLFGYLTTLFPVHYLYSVECDIKITIMKYTSSVFEYFTTYFATIGSGKPHTSRVRIGGSLAGVRSTASSVQIESCTNLPICVMDFYEVLWETLKIYPSSEQGINIFQSSSVNCNIKLCVFIVMFMYSHCYVCSVLYILFSSCQLAHFGYPGCGFSVLFPQL
jgi:hypothetical protein